MPFLEVITRCYKRPLMLAANIASLKAQTDQDYTQTFLVDEIGRGVGWSYENMAAYAVDLTGDYVWILDDDDMCIRTTLVAELKQIVEAHNPDVIMVRMNHQERGILPSGTWRAYPVIGDIGCSAYIVRREVWQQYAAEFSRGDYSNDYYFIAAVFDNPSLKFFWHNVVASQVQWIGLGRPEGTG